MKFSSHYVRAGLGIYTLTIGFAYVFSASFLTIPEANQRTVDTALGYMLGVVTTVSVFYFGSSQGSADKDKSNNGNT